MQIYSSIIGHQSKTLTCTWNFTTKFSCLEDEWIQGQLKIGDQVTAMLTGPNTLAIIGQGGLFINQD